MELYLSACVHDEQIKVTLETLIIIFVHRYADAKIPINLVLQDESDEPLFGVQIEGCKVLKPDRVPGCLKYCLLPIAIVNNIRIISGLCSVTRQVIINLNKTDSARKLLGFREACLATCNESSIWTKFCEIDMIGTVKNICTETQRFVNSTIKIPRDLTRFENHLTQPVRLHNVYKVAQDSARLQNKKVSDVNSSIRKDELDLLHEYSEGPFLTLSDIILYPSVHILATILSVGIFESNLPLVYKWYNKIQRISSDFNFSIPVDLTDISYDKTVSQDSIQVESLYVSDPQRYKPRNRIYTKQTDIINAMNIVRTLPIEISTETNSMTDDFDWLEVPLEAKPQSGALPEARMTRKCEQLENLAKAVIKIAKPSDVIVDFCSGSGHLGILLAVKLPFCKIILLENKEKSMTRAVVRVEKLKLSNIIFLQCNLDYFIGKFDIGVSLHACGVATDLVIQQCIKQNVAFVSCPCCYGGVHDCHHITYPRSKVFCDSVGMHDYLVLGHAADQTHDAGNAKTKQGIECMNIIDMDRKLQAEEHGFEVTLTKMMPETCTPKNNILIGIPTPS